MSDPALHRRVNNMLIAAGVVGDSLGGGCHRAQISGRANEAKGGIRILTPFGFAMRLVPGNDPETVLLAVESNLRYALPPADPRYQPDDLDPGESALYNADDPDGGCRIHLKRGRVIQVICHTAEIKADDLIRLEADRIQLHARVSYSWDVDGYGWRCTAQGGGAYTLTTWQTDAVVTPETLPINPPEGP